ncbi:Filamin-A, partial [Trichoplax sp. H2]
NGNFVVDTRTAGEGILRVRIYGPKGGFAVYMSRNPEMERLIDVRYNPTEIGHYKIDIKWSDVHIPGSPFDIWIVSSPEELKKIQMYENTEGWVKYV